MDLDDVRSSRSQRMEYLLTELGLIDLVWHFRQRRQFWDLKACTQFQQGTVLRSRFDYILWEDRCRFELVRIRDMRNYMSNHFPLQ